MNPISACFAYVALALVVASCASSDPAQRAPQQARLGETVVLERGEVVRFADADIVVRFDSISNDTRCPEDVACADRGEASAHFSLRTADSDTATPFVLKVAGQLPSDAVQSIQEAATSDDELTAVEVEGYPARLYLLQPYPGFAAERRMTPTAVFSFGEADL